MTTETKIIFIDADGTLISYNDYLPESAKKALTLAKNKGHKIILSTGRSKIQLPDILDTLDFDGYILGNGAYVEYQHQIIFHNTIGSDETLDIMAFLDAHKLAYYLESNDGLFISDDFENVSHHAFAKYAKMCGKEKDEPSTVYNTLKGIKDKPSVYPPINKISYVLNDHQDFETVSHHFPKFNHVVWGGSSISAVFGYISARGISKGEGVERMLEYLDIPKERSVSFGDSNIDISMFEATGTSVCLGNGTDDAKQAADYLTDDIEKDGLYKAFKDLNLI